MTPSSQKLPRFVLDWIWTTAIGWIGVIPSLFMAAPIAQVVSAVFWPPPQPTEYHFQSNRLDDVLCFLVPLGAAIAINSLYGYRQWHIALKLYVQKRPWIVANHLGMLAGWIAVIVVGNILPPVFQAYGGDLSGLNVGLTILDTWYSTLIFGGTFGLFMALPQWWVLRKHLRLSIIWFATVILASSTAAVVIVPIARILKNIYFTYACGCLAMPMVFAILTGVVMYQFLRHTKPSEEKSSVSS